MNRILVPLIAFVILVFSNIGVFANSSVVYSKMWMRGVRVHVVTVDLNDRNVKVSPALAHRGIGYSEGFGSMLSRLKPSAAITGTYFSVRSLIPVGDIVVSGQHVHKGDVGTIVCFTQDNNVEFKSLKDSRTINWNDYPYAISTGPRLVTYGVTGVYPRDEGFKDHALYRMARRSALGVTKSRKLLLVTVDNPVYLSKLAAIMHDLNSYHAVNLDGGTSTALHCQGRSYCHPGRRLTNLIVVYESQDIFLAVKSELMPSGSNTKAPKKT